MSLADERLAETLAAQATAGLSRRRRTVDARAPAAFASPSKDAKASISAATIISAWRTTPDRRGVPGGRAPAGCGQRRLASGQRSRRRTSPARGRAGGVRRAAARPALFHRLHGEPRRCFRAGRPRRSRAGRPAQSRFAARRGPRLRRAVSALRARRCRGAARQAARIGAIGTHAGDDRRRVQHGWRHRAAG